jgi:iron(III) transport system substrate-binding protein
MKAEGANSPADVLLTVDIGRMDDAVKAEVSQPIKSEALDKIVPAQYRDPDGHWAGISMRARVIYASKDRVKQETITYEELADPKWKGKICIRSGQHISRKNPPAGIARPRATLPPANAISASATPITGR